MLFASNNFSSNAILYSLPPLTLSVWIAPLLCLHLYSYFVNMSSVFSFENWDQLLDPAVPTLTSSESPSSSSLSSATSGEYQPFVSIGAHVSGEGIGNFFPYFMGAMLVVCVVGSLVLQVLPSFVCERYLVVSLLMLENSM